MSGEGNGTQMMFAKFAQVFGHKCHRMLHDEICAPKNAGLQPLSDVAE